MDVVSSSVVAPRHTAGAVLTFLDVEDAANVVDLIKVSKT